MSTLVWLFTLTTFFPWLNWTTEPYLNLAIKQIARQRRANKARRRRKEQHGHWNGSKNLLFRLKTSYCTHCLCLNRRSGREKQKQHTKKLSAHQIKIQIEISNIYPAARCLFAQFFERPQPPSSPLSTPRGSDKSQVIVYVQPVPVCNVIFRLFVRNKSQLNCC